MRGIYIHIPFCSAFCLYCGFYSVNSTRLREQFVKAVVNEAAEREEFFAICGNEELDSDSYTLYFGGGTPSIISVEQIVYIVSSLKELFNIKYIKEFTVEVNPDDITYDYANALLEAGVDRVSMGVQSFIDGDLAWMKRRHDSACAVRAYRILREVGFKNIGLDLIFGYSLLKYDNWRYNIEKIIELSPEHISAYQMSMDKGSALFKLHERGLYSMPDQDSCREQYELLQKSLSGAGYIQYEISNFARHGFKSIHNGAYWDGTPYIGLGPGAHSYTGAIRDESGKIFAERRWNKCNLTQYLRVYNNKTVSGYCNVPDGYKIFGKEQLSPVEMFNEKIMLGLRTTCGVDTDSLNVQLLKKISPEIERLSNLGMIRREGGRIWIPEDHFFISDSIIRNLFI